MRRGEWVFEGDRGGSCTKRSVIRDPGEEVYTRGLVFVIPDWTVRFVWHNHTLVLPCQPCKDETTALQR
jgi:hypothetical protein